MDVVREIGAVVVVFGLLGLFLYAGKRAQWLTAGLRNASGGARRMELVETLRVGPAAAIHMVRIDQRLVIVAVHGTGCTLLKAYEESNTPSDESIVQNRE